MSTTFNSNKILVGPHVVSADEILSPGIRYKKLDAQRFIAQGYTVSEEELQPDENGYISEALFHSISSDEESNTTIVNVGVGQGKTTAALNLIRYYGNQENTIVVVACPFKTLIQKYYEALVGTEDAPGISRNALFDYRAIDPVLIREEIENEANKRVAANQSENSNAEVEEQSDEDVPFLHTTSPLETAIQELTEERINQFVSHKIHLVTINALLGNPGENAHLQTGLKRRYLRAVRNLCSGRENRPNQRVVLLIDEIHESIHNFEEELIFYLRMWKGVTHKTIVLSATYTEPAVVACFHISYLTDHKIKLINSPRRKIEEDRLANLYFYLTPKKYSSNNSSELDYLRDIEPVASF